MMKGDAEIMRTEMTYPGKIKKIGNAYYIGILKEYVDMLGAGDGTDVDVHVKLVNPPER